MIVDVFFRFKREPFGVDVSGFGVSSTTDIRGMHPNDQPRTVWIRTEQQDCHFKFVFIIKANFKN